ncbi:MAG TPA: YbaY family lipoprotein [Xanthomonadales bacterium]|nr:YbaY family lipoprotein [Xanthomonadales bacterium]
MRFLTVSLASLAMLLAACGKSEQPAPSAGGTSTPAAQQSSGPAVTGMVLADAPRSLAGNAMLNVRLLDVTRAEGDPIVVTQNQTPITAIPAQFSLPYVSADINSIRSYALDVSIMENGQILFVSTGRPGVLTNGKPNKVDIMLAQAMAPAAEKDPVVEFNKEYADFEARLGGLKRKNGQRVIGPEGKETAAIGWDAFVDDTGVRMVRETVTDADGNNRSTRKFAYKDGKPWVAISDASGSEVKIGWDADGNVVVAEKGGQADESAKDQADALKREATEAAAAAG